MAAPSMKALPLPAEWSWISHSTLGTSASTSAKQGSKEPLNLAPSFAGMEFSMGEGLLHSPRTFTAPRQRTGCLHMEQIVFKSPIKTTEFKSQRYLGYQHHRPVLEKPVPEHRSSDLGPGCGRWLALLWEPCSLSHCVGSVQGRGLSFQGWHFPAP